MCHPSRRLTMRGSAVPLSACSSSALAMTSRIASGTPQWSRIFSTLRSKSAGFFLVGKALLLDRYVHRRPVQPAVGGGHELDAGAIVYLPPRMHGVQHLDLDRGGRGSHGEWKPRSAAVDRLIKHELLEHPPVGRVLEEEAAAVSWRCGPTHGSPRRSGVKRRVGVERTLGLRKHIRDHAIAWKQSHHGQEPHLWQIARAR